MNKTLTLVCGLVLLAFGTTLQAEAIRDYYSEPGIQAFKGFEGEFMNERIDTFGGTVQVGFTDLVVPGNGGLDIKVTRTFTSHQEQLQYPQFMGMGWTMHYGRIVVPYDNRDKVCEQGLWQDTSADNPSLELPDGAREMLVLDNYSGAADPYLITKSNWKVTCVGGYFNVKSPDGTTYIMDKFFVGDEQTAAWYTSKITDRNGNTLDLTYDVVSTDTGPKHFLTTITASDGRVVNYVYQDAYLFQIKVNEEVMAEYHYAPAEGLSWSFPPMNLTEVVLPEGRKWIYNYNPKQIDPVQLRPLPSSNQLQSIIYPTGARVEYNYQSVYFDRFRPEFPTFVVASKTIFSADEARHPAGTWTYTYRPESQLIEQANSSMDVVRIDGPESAVEYWYYGTGYVRNSINMLWTVGLPYKRLVYEQGATTPIEEQVYGYDKRLVSNEDYWHGGNEWDNYTWAAVKTSDYTSRDNLNGGVATFYENFDAFGNPQRVRQAANTTAGPSYKVTDTVYQHDLINWVIGLPTQVTVSDQNGAAAKVTNNVYDEKGRLTSSETAGVTSSTTYDAEGNVATTTDPRNKVTSYSSYYRGEARQIHNPDSTTVTRTVDSFGRITSITNELNKTRSFDYDKLGRLTGIIYPTGSPVSISYGIRDKVMTRGAFQERVDTDGWGRDTEITRTDTVKNNAVVIHHQYSAEGKKTFTSYPNSVTGTEYKYDGLGRLYEVKHPDGKSIATTYRGSEQTVTDEKNNVRVLMYHNYGSFDGGQLVKVVELGVTGDEPGTYITSVSLNVHGQPVQVMQGILDADGYITGKSRSYVYDSRYFLASEVNPETGTTTYGRDNAGNMTAKTVGALPAIGFSYDDRGRLDVVDYPDTVDQAVHGLVSSQDVNYDYDDVGNVVSTTKGTIVRQFGYTDNGNLDWEKMTVDGVILTADYTYNALDYLSALTYPTGRSVSYEPDALGRATKVGSHIPLIEYHPTGQVKTLTYANGVSTAINLNARQMVQSLHTYGSQGDFINRTFDYDDTQNITAINDLNTPSKSRLYGYDQLGRLVHAVTPWGEMNYGYSRNDALLRMQTGSSTTNLGYANGKLQQRADRRYYYDALGNMNTNVVINSQFPSGVDKYEFVYDQSGVLRTAKRDGWLQPKTWRYDAEGMRVVNDTIPSSPTYYFHDKAGQLLGEYGANVAYGKETIYLGEQSVVTIKTNEAPVANAGSDVSILAGDLTTLEGISSVDPEGRLLVFGWQQISGPTAVTQSLSASAIRVTAPSVAVTSTLTFELSVTDDKGEVAVDTVAVTVQPYTPPVANAGTDSTVLSGDSVQLNGSAFGGEGTLQSRWSQVSGPTVALSSTTYLRPTFTAPPVSTSAMVVLSLQVTDGMGRVASDTVTFTVLSRSADNDIDGLPDSWEQFYFGSATLYTASSDPDGDGLTNAQEYGEGSNPIVAESIPATVVLAVEAGEGANLLQWPQVKGAAQYTIYWSNTAGFDLATASKIVTTKTRFLHSGLLNQRTYYYRVTATNNSGESTPSSELSAITNIRAWQRSSVSTALEKTNRYQASLDNWSNSIGGYVAPYVTITDKLTGKKFTTVINGVENYQGFLESKKVAVNDEGGVGVTFVAFNKLYAAYIPLSNNGVVDGRFIGSYCPDTYCAKRFDGAADQVGPNLAFSSNGTFFLYFKSSGGGLEYLEGYCSDKAGNWTSVSPGSGDWIYFDRNNVSAKIMKDGKIFLSWVTQGTRDHTLSVRQVDCGGAGITSLLNYTASGVGMGAPFIEANAKAVSVYFNNSSSKLAAMDYNRTTATWGASYALPGITGYSPSRMQAWSSSDNIEVIMHSGANSKGTATKLAAITRVPGGSWRTGVLDLGGFNSNAIIKAVVSAKDEAVLVYSDYQDRYVRSSSVSGVWGAAQNILEYGFTNTLTGNEVGNVRLELGQTGSVDYAWYEYKPAPYVPDVTAPVTTSTKSKYSSKGKTYMDITLTANESATTSFRITGAATITAGGAANTNWQTYSGKITVQLTGTGVLEFYSVDTVGNTEATKTETLQ